MNAQRYWINADGGLVVQPERFYADDDVVMATDYDATAARVAVLEAALLGMVRVENSRLGNSLSCFPTAELVAAQDALASPAKGPPMNLHNLPRDES